MLASVVLGLLLLTSSDVADRCSTEAGWADGVHLCACTVKSRLDAGWTRGSVLDAYYSKAEPGQGDRFLAEAERGLKGEGCPKDAYYLWSEQDVKSLGLDPACATGFSRGNGKWIYTFGRRALKECRIGERP